MAEPKTSGRWTSFFKRKDLEGEDFFGKFLGAISKIFEGANEEETFRTIRSELVRVFDCDDLSLYYHDPAIKPGMSDGDWVLQVKSGFGQGTTICQTDALSLPELVPGIPMPETPALNRGVATKAVALAFDEGCFYGADIEKGKVVLLKNPTPEDDMGSGDLSVLAIPLHYNSEVGRVVEKTRVGVLVLFKTPVRREMADMEKHLRTLISHAIVAPRCMLRDPVTGLLTEDYLRENLDKQLGLWELTKGKLRGGLVIGMIDTLKLYKQTLESAGNIDPRVVSEKVSEVLRGVASCVNERANNHGLGGGDVYRSGTAGRIGHEGFGVVLPLLQEQELLMWAVRLSKSVIDYHFEGENLMDAGDITVSLRAIPFQRGTPQQLWDLSQRALQGIQEEQLRVRRDPSALSSVVSTIRIFKRGCWLTSGEYSQELR
jgi:GGDEF domain-containing protein